MISLQDALDLIQSHQASPCVAQIKTSDGLRRVLAADVFAPMDLPPFMNATVDGFAVDTQKILPLRSYEVTHTVWAGAQRDLDSECSIAKIMTGAPLPQGVDAVVMKEHVRFHNGAVIIPEMPKTGSNVRFAGEDIKKGEKVLCANTQITPQKIGVLLGLGIDEICVYHDPKIKVICTGDELVRAPNQLQFGQVYFLVGDMLRAQCAELGLGHVDIQLVGDCERTLQKAINESSAYDLILLTGGMSMGERDLVRTSLKKSGAQEIFYQGYWRPGMPLWFGKKDRSFIFGLPGNPVAVFVCFHIFVRAHILGSMGLLSKLKMRAAVLQNSFEKQPGFATFARAYVNEINELTIFTAQGSHQIFGLAQANALCYLTPGQVAVKPNDIVYYHPI